jgi:tryptophanyl-tRNA synthetase
VLFLRGRLARADHRLRRYLAGEGQFAGSVFDWLAAGLDPEKSTIFIQSHVPAHAELHLLLSMITPLGWLERVPTYKEQRRTSRTKTWELTDFWAIRCCRRPTF